MELTPAQAKSRLERCTLTRLKEELSRNARPDPNQIFKNSNSRGSIQLNSGQDGRERSSEIHSESKISPTDRPRVASQPHDPDADATGFPDAATDPYDY